ncbi:MAG: D-alanyl-D-alanine carboxypeptidase family protein [bacterium]|nr:D-alanyl-D-alanine carboxypeptidase family protein [bacterium]
MKKRFFLLLFALLLLPVNIKAEENTELIKNATSGLLMEQSTGEIIFEKDKDKQVAVASMTKMVAQTIILENIESGKIKWDDIVSVSKNAADMGGSQIYLTAGEKMSVKDLFKGISMASANDATVAMAEYIAGDEASFVKLMNKKVKELGLKNTTFKNSTGLDEEGHLSTAYDMAIIARNLLNHEKILDFSSVYEDYLRQDTENKFWLVNTNKLVRFYDGADGLKTGHTDAAKYCLAATAKKDGMRLIAIVLGEENSKIRNSETMALLDYGFNTKKITVVKKKDKVVKELEFDKGDKEKIQLVPKYDVGVLENKASRGNKYKYNIEVDKIKLPIKQGDILGKIIVKDGKKEITKVDLVSKTSIKKLNYIELYIETVKNSILGIIN